MFAIFKISIVYYILALILFMIIWKVWRWEGGLLIAYVLLIVAETLLIRKPFIGQHFQPELFWSWRVWERQRDQILANVVMFIPVGVLAGLLWRWRGLLFALGVSCGIEVLQLITARGLCEFDDIIHNMAGAVVGIGIVMMVRQVKWRTKGFESLK